MTRIHEDVAGVAAPLQERVQHFMSHQPLLSEGVCWKINAIALPNPPGVRHLSGKLYSSGGCIDGVKAYVAHPPRAPRAGHRFVPPLLI